MSFKGKLHKMQALVLIEKVGSLTSELIDSFNPLTLIPFVKDIVSIAQGYDVERSDMAVITDLFNAWKKLSSDNLSVYRKVEGFGGNGLCSCRYVQWVSALKQTFREPRISLRSLRCRSMSK